MSQTRVNVGQRIKVHRYGPTGRALEFVRVLRVHDEGVEAVSSDSDWIATEVRFYRWSYLELPQRPKAEAGVIYRRTGVDSERWVGLADGHLYGHGYTTTFEPTLFEKLEPQP